MIQFIEKQHSYIFSGLLMRARYEQLRNYKHNKKCVKANATPYDWRSVCKNSQGPGIEEGKPRVMLSIGWEWNAFFLLVGKHA